MKPYVKLYMDAFRYDIGDFIPCEVEGPNCGNRAVDVNHIDARGMGGSKTKDYIENLMGTCRECHNDYGDIKDAKPILKAIHKKVMEHAGVKFDPELI